MGKQTDWRSLAATMRSWRIPAAHGKAARSRGSTEDEATARHSLLSSLPGLGQVDQYAADHVTAKGQGNRFGRHRRVESRSQLETQSRLNSASRMALTDVANAGRVPLEPAVAPAHPWLSAAGTYGTCRRFHALMCHKCAIELLLGASLKAEDLTLKPLTSTNARWAPSGSNRRPTD